MPKIKKITILATVFVLGIPFALSSAQHVASTSALPANLEIPRRVTIGTECWGRSDYPHISTHRPRTVNVVAETFCPGKGVSIRTTLWRQKWVFFRESASVSRSGTGSVKVT